jgi:hypothetical protein
VESSGGFYDRRCRLSSRCSRVMFTGTWLRPLTVVGSLFPRDIRRFVPVIAFAKPSGLS